MYLDNSVVDKTRDKLQLRKSIQKLLQYAREPTEMMLLAVL